jgi:rRNA maturation endonuclease Nob1
MEEIEMLKNRIAELEAASGKERGEVIKEVLSEHLEKSVLEEERKMPEPEIKKEAERISGIKEEEPHQRQIVELLQLAQDKGVLNALSVVKSLNDPHLEDDFHAALINFFQNV